MTTPLTLHVPEDMVATWNSSEEFGHALRLAAAIKWFELGRISQGKAAELAGLSRADFIEALAAYEVSPFQLTAEELAEEVGRALTGDDGDFGDQGVATI